jgi:septal ring factor EnvC (AmiA/AmiB activator)
MKKFTIVSILLISACGAFAQDTLQTLDSKWNYMLNKSETYQDYKVINKTILNTMYKSIQDSLSKFRADLLKERASVKEQSDRIASLEKQIKDDKTAFDTINNEKDSIGFLGMQINKYAYVSLLWILLIALSVGTVLMFFLYKNSKKITNVKSQEYEVLAKQLEEAKATKTETEKKLKREMQTLMNKLEELKRK